jgi:hypothetical protein
MKRSLLMWTLGALVAMSTLSHRVAFAQWIDQPVPQIPDAEGRDHPEAADEWFYAQRTFGSPAGMAEARLRALAVRDAMALPNGKFSTLSQPPTWSILGPINTIGGGAHDGRVNAMAVDPKNSSIAYCGAAMGGVWKTINKGQTWLPLTDHVVSLAMGAIAIDPTNTQIVYAGTGEFAGNINSYFGSGMIKSSDGGATWRGIGLGGAGAFSQIVAHPSISGRVYAAAAKSGGGVWRTDDGGTTWTKLSNGLPPAEVTDLALAVDGANDVLYAAVPSHGVYLSKDGGTSWTVAFQDPPFLDMRRVHVDVNPKNWKQAVAMSVDHNGGFEGVVRTNDGGATPWQEISGSLRSSSIFNSGGSQQGWYDAYVKMDPTKSSHIIVGGISIWDTQDDGNTWTDAGLAYQGGIHPDQHIAAFAPSDPTFVYAGCDGGPVLSQDNGATYTSQQDNLAVVQFYSIAVDQTVPQRNLGGTQDNGTQEGGLGDWNEVGGGDGGTVTINQNNPSTYWSWQPTVILPVRIDGGNTVQMNLPRVYVGGAGVSDDSAWIKPIVFDSKGNTLYAATNFFYYSKNLGASWTRRGLRSANRTDTSDITAIDPAGDGNTVLVGTSKGKVYSSTNNGTNWSDLSPGLPTRAITGVRFGPSSKTTMYVTQSGFGGGHVFKSVDGGSTWTNISSNLPDIPCNVIVIDPQNPKALYLGTDVGVFFSPDDGGSWLPYGAGLPNVVILDMAIHETGRVLRVGTHGRSMWQVPLSTDIAGITSPTNGSVWYTGDATTISWRGFADAVTVELSLDAGQSWILLSSSATGSSLQLNPMHYPASDNALIRVRNTQDTVVTPLFRIAQRKAGSIVKFINELPIYMYDVAYDPDNKVLWATDFSTTDTKIYKVDPDLGTNLGIKYDVANKHLFIHQSHQSDVGQCYFYEVTTTGQQIQKQPSPSNYGTGILVRADTVYLVDRDPVSGNNQINTQSLVNPSFTYNPLLIQSRRSLFGPRCLTYDPNRNMLLNTWTDFQAIDTTSSTTLYDSYLLQLDPADATERGSTFLQVSGNQSVNVRGLEIDPRDGYKSAWVTILDDASGGTSAKLYKITLVDGPVGNLGVEKAVHPEDYSLGQNYPNPFNPSTTIPYELRQSGVVQLQLFDVMGKMVYASSPKFEPAGKHERTFAFDHLPSGTYTYVLTMSGQAVSHKKMLLMK